MRHASGAVAIQQPLGPIPPTALLTHPSTHSTHHAHRDHSNHTCWLCNQCELQVGAHSHPVVIPLAWQLPSSHIASQAQQPSRPELQLHTPHCQHTPAVSQASVLLRVPLPQARNCCWCMAALMHRPCTMQHQNRGFRTEGQRSRTRLDDS